MSKRIETGVVQFGDDWPGIFIRGDTALYWSMLLRRLMDQAPPTNTVDEIERASLVNLCNLLASCEQGSGAKITKYPDCRCILEKS